MQEFETKIRVRYADTDQMGVMYYANYLVFFEVARTEFFRSIDLPYIKLEEKGIYLPVAESYCKYRSPALYDDVLLIKTILNKMSFVKLEFFYKVFRENNILCAEGYTVHGFIDKNRRVIKIPEDIKKRIKNKLNVD